MNDPQDAILDAPQARPDEQKCRQARFDTMREEDRMRRRLMERRYGVRQIACALIASGESTDPFEGAAHVVRTALRINAMIEDAVR